MNSTQMQKTSGSLNYQWAFSLIHYLALQGVTQAVISPGSRSTPLALACEQHPEIQTWIQIDERSAGFFALGLGQQKQRPALLICTSGSAVANWFPAVVEASHSYTPLLLLSADRPAELQNCGANQTIDQNFLFGAHVRNFMALEDADILLLKSDYLKTIASRAYSQTLSQKPGAVHLNIPFREPLLPRRFTAGELNRYIQHLNQQILADTGPIVRTKVQKKNQTGNSTANNEQNSFNLIKKIVEKANGLIICGRLSQQEQINFDTLLALLADKLNCPVLVDPLSNQRFNTSQPRHYIYNYDQFIKQKKKHSLYDTAPEWIIRFGQFPISKNLLHYLQSLECHTILISSYGDTLDPIHKANTVLQISPEKFCRKLLNIVKPNKSTQWLEGWQQVDQSSEAFIYHSIQKCQQLFEGHVIQLLLELIPEHSLLFSGNSMAIRDFDTCITRSCTNKALYFFANRGVSGIDGNLSTFFGLLASQKNYGVALLGDLSFYHDMNGLLVCQQLLEQELSATIIVINNNGGGIFNYLPQQQLNDFNKLWKTEINLDFQHSARLYGLNYHKVSTKKQLAQTLAKVFTLSGIQLVEIIIDQQTSVECHENFF